MFLLNLGRTAGRAAIQPEHPLQSARDLREGRDLQVTEGRFEIEVAPGSVRLVLGVRA